jgi:hypothetical protein
MMDRMMDDTVPFSVLYPRIKKDTPSLLKNQGFVDDTKGQGILDDTLAQILKHQNIKTKL